MTDGGGPADVHQQKRPSPPSLFAISDFSPPFSPLSHPPPPLEMQEKEKENRETDHEDLVHQMNRLSPPNEP